MAFNFSNKTNGPVNIVVSNGGFIYFYKNALPAGASWSCSPEGVWYDVLVSFNLGEDIDPAKHNWTQAVAIGTTVLGGAIAIGSVVLIPFSGGTSAAATSWGIALAASGLSVATVAVGATIANAVLNPATEDGFYGFDNYSLDIVGAIDGAFNTNNNQLSINGVNPIGINWKNIKSGKSGSTLASGHATISDPKIIVTNGNQAGVLHMMMQPVS